MKRRLAVLILAGTMTIPVFAAKGPEVDMVDNRLSINAEAVPLGRLLRFFDLATGLKSKVPAELANRNISVRFSDLNIADGVKKIFQGQPLDYVVIEGQGVIVTAVAQTSTGEPASAYIPKTAGRTPPGCAFPRRLGLSAGMVSPPRSRRCWRYRDAPMACRPQIPAETLRP